jgi:hypothetical protein
MDTPTAATVRLRSRLPWADYGIAAPEGPDDPLQEEVADAVEYVEGVTGRKLDGTMPAAYERRAAKDVVMRTEQQVVQAEQGNVESGADELTSSASAGAVSESRRAFSDNKAANEAWLVNRWPALNDLLWQVMTPEMRAYWLAYLKGEELIPPGGGFNVVEVDWSGANRGAVADYIPGHHLEPGGWPDDWGVG